MTSEAWNALMPHEIKLTPAKIEPFQCKEALQRLPDNGIGIQFAIGPERFPSMVVFSDKLLHGVLANVLDLPGEEWPDVRAFTRAEESMLSVLFQGMANAISDGIPGPEATLCRYSGMSAKAQRTRVFALVDDLFVNDITVSSRYGEDQAVWLLPKKQTEELIGHELMDDDIEDRRIQPDMVSLAHKLSVDLVVELGKADVRMSQISQLSEGDVLILNQSIHRPLKAYVGGTAKMNGRPVRVGYRQGFEVADLIAE